MENYRAATLHNIHFAFISLGSYFITPIMLILVVALYHKIATSKNLSLHIVEFEDRLVDEKYALLCTA